MTFHWELVSAPAGSTSALEGSTSVNPTFLVDLPGTYVIQLIVSDGNRDSAADNTEIATDNSRPATEAGPNQTVVVYDLAQLDGSASTDVDGDPLTFAWLITSRPVGSGCALSDPASLNPVFVVDQASVYVVELIVHDGQLASLPDSVKISTINSAPVANAGPDRKVLVGDRVHLNGSGSSDVDGDVLAFSWSFTARPEGSLAIRDDPDAVTPAFTADLPDTYVAQLVVPDGTEYSAPDTVKITTGNSRPVARAGPDRSVSLGETVVLDGSASYDADGDPLTFAWSMVSRPAGSKDTLSTADSAYPSFFVDEPGTYVFQLIVNDGFLDSAADTVSVATENSAPLAVAGSDQVVPVGSEVELDGRGSSDPDGDALLYEWAIIAKPIGSDAAPENPTSPITSFLADEPGAYVAQLIVNDSTVDSATDTVTVTTENRPPTADAGTDQSVDVGATVQLDGGACRDPDADPLSYAWSLTTVPTGSAAALSDPTAVNPTFQADLAGTYVAQLTVNDGKVDSVPDLVAVIAGSGRPVADAGPDQSERSDIGIIQLDGRGSSDPDGDPLTFSWSILVSPEGHNASISNPTLAQQTALPIAISPNPAHSGGVLVDVVSSDPATIEVLTPTVTIPEGAISANATVRGANVGSASVVAGNPGYSSATSQVTSQGDLNILQTSATFTPGFPTDITVRLESGGTPVAAPAPGIAVTLTPEDPRCLAVTSPSTIPTGLVSANVELNYGGTSTLPCSTTLTAGSTALSSDSITVTVDPDPEITLTNLPVTVGAGLQTYYNGYYDWTGNRLRAVLGGSEHDGVTVRIQSSSPEVALVSPDATTPGTAFFDTFVPNGSTTVYYCVQAVEGKTGTVTITGSAPGFIDGTGTVQVVQSALDIVNLAAAIGATAPSDPFQVRVGVPNTYGTALTVVQSVRVGGGDLLITVTNSNAQAGQLYTLSGGAQSRGVLIPEGSSISQSTVASGGIEFDPLETGDGKTTVEATNPFMLTTLAGMVSVTVSP